MKVAARTGSPASRAPARPLLRSIRCALLLAVFASCSGERAASTPAATSEEALIERLIARVEGLQGAVFIRNGSEHSPKEAGDHLRRKRKSLGEKVRSADEFIESAASRSSFSGKAYAIRFADGSTKTSAEFLRAELARMRSGE